MLCSLDMVRPCQTSSAHLSRPQQGWSGAPQSGSEWLLRAGLPTLKGSDALKEYDEFENEWYFSYPKAWVARPNSQRSGFYVSNFQTVRQCSKAEASAPPTGHAHGSPAGITPCSSLKPCGWGKVSCLPNHALALQADKATVESFPVPEGDGPEADKELIRRAVAAAVVPGKHIARVCQSAYAQSACVYVFTSWD